MHFATALSAAALAAVVSAVDIPVAVGKDGLKFTPDSVNATKNDNIVFTVCSLPAKSFVAY